MMIKSELRTYFLAQRKKLSPLELRWQSQLISKQFFKHVDVVGINYLHLFLPIKKQHEINTWFIIDQLRRDYPHITPVIPKSHFQTKQMESYLFDRHTQIVENHLGILEPKNAIKCPDKQIDMILIPLLCFDKQGFRVGYGEGFYDRYLLKCKKNIIKIGLSLFEPVDKIADINDYDIKMDFCIMTNWIWQG